MNSPNPKDLLSAFYDREVAPEEEAAAQAQVQRSPEAGREVKDYARLSRLLQQLPQLTAPPEFAAAVMRRAERECLIPLDPVPTRRAADPVRAEALSVDVRRRRWILASIAAASVAAVALIAVMFLGPSGPPAFHREIAAIQPHEPLANVNTRKVSIGSDNVRDSKHRTGAVVRRDLSAVRVVTTAPTAERPAPTGAAAAASPALAKATQPPSSGKSHELALMLPANLKTAKVGDVVEALQQDGQQVAVVRLTVVNQVEGLDGVQSVLVRNTSRTLQNADEIKRMRQQFGADKSGDVPKSALRAAPGDLICVYVEGSRDEMVGVLHDLQTERHIQAAELTNTISYTALEQYHAVLAQKQAGGPVAADGQVPSAPAPQAPAKSTGSQLAVSLPASTVDKILSANQAPTAVGGRQNARSAARAEKVVQETPAAAAPVPPTSELAQQQSAKERAAPAGETANVARRAARAGSRSTAKHGGRSDLWGKDEIASSGKSFQIFFVITDQAPAQSNPPASATAKPAAKPAPPAAPSPVPVWSGPKKRAH